MDFGWFFLPKPHEAAEEAMAAEENGFTHAWIGDSQMLLADVYVCLGICALHTRRIKLGPNVTNPHSRIAPVTACAIATINQLAPGRTILGIGTGNTARRALGLPAAKLAELRDYITVGRKLLRGEVASYSEGNRQRLITFLQPEKGWINLTDAIPIYMAASGPKALEMAGEIADGVIIFGAVAESLLHYTLSHVERGAKRSGRSLSDLYIVCLTPFYLRRAGEPLDAMRQKIGLVVFSAANIFALSCKEPEVLPPDLRADLMAVKDIYGISRAPEETRHLKAYGSYISSIRQEHLPLLTERLMSATAIVGTEAECCETIRKMEKAGVKQVAIWKTSPDDLATFAKHIIARY